MLLGVAQVALIFLRPGRSPQPLAESAGRMEQAPYHFQSQPQPPARQPHAPALAFSPATAPEPLDFAGALKTESWGVLRSLEQCGHATDWARERTICS